MPTALCAQGLPLSLGTWSSQSMLQGNSPEPYASVSPSANHQGCDCVSLNLKRGSVSLNITGSLQTANVFFSNEKSVLGISTADRQEVLQGLENRQALVWIFVNCFCFNKLRLLFCNPPPKKNLVLQWIKASNAKKRTKLGRGVCWG